MHGTVNVKYMFRMSNICCVRSKAPSKQGRVEVTGTAYHISVYPL